MQIIVTEIQCPKCGAGETNPKTAHLPILEQTFLIRAFKVCINGKWRSQCLVCAGVCDKDGNDLPFAGDWRKGGWFCS